MPEPDSKTTKRGATPPPSQTPMTMATKVKFQNAKMRDSFVEGLLAKNRDLEAEVARLVPFEARCAELEANIARVRAIVQ